MMTTNSWNSLRRLVRVIPMAICANACNLTGLLVPEEMTKAVGTYDLVSFNGRAVPQAPTERMECGHILLFDYIVVDSILSGTFSLKSDGLYEETRFVYGRLTPWASKDSTAAVGPSQRLECGRGNGAWRNNAGVLEFRPLGFLFSTPAPWVAQESSGFERGATLTVNKATYRRR